MNLDSVVVGRDGTGGAEGIGLRRFAIDLALELDESRGEPRLDIEVPPVYGHFCTALASQVAGHGDVRSLYDSSFVFAGIVFDDGNLLRRVEQLQVGTQAHGSVSQGVGFPLRVGDGQGVLLGLSLSAEGKKQQ